MATRMLQRRGTAAEWSAANPILESGEIGFIRDTNRIKIGDGATAWNALPAFTVDSAADSGNFLPVNGKAADADKLDGIDSTGFVKASGTGSTAYDSARLGGVAASSYALKTGVVDPSANVTFTGRVGFGDADNDVTDQRALVVETHTRNTVNTYTNGKLTQVLERMGTTTVKTTTLNYTGDVLTSTVEVAGGKTVTTTLVYTNGVLTSTTRTVA